MPTITQIVAQIRTAIYGKDVRENIAQGIEKCYQDSTANAQIQAIIAKGQETLNSIPENYTELSEEVDDLKSALDEQRDELVILEDTGYFVKYNVPRAAKQDGWKLVEDGSRADGGSNSIIEVYPVIPGDIIKVVATKYTECVFLFAVLATGTVAGNVIGTPWNESFNGFVKVPEGADVIKISHNKSTAASVAIVEENSKKFIPYIDNRINSLASATFSEFYVDRHKNTVSGWKLKYDGGREENPNSSYDIYQNLNAGDILYVNATKYTEVVGFFSYYENNSTVIVGDVFYDSIDGFLIVPEGATRISLSRQSSYTGNIVRKQYTNNEIQTIHVNSVNEVLESKGAVSYIEGSNRFNKNSEYNIDGFYIDNGQYVADANYFITHLMKVKPSTTYYKRESAQGLLYDKNLNLIEFVPAGTTFTTTSNAAYYRTNCSMYGKSLFYVSETNSPSNFADEPIATPDAVIAIQKIIDESSTIDTRVESVKSSYVNSTPTDKKAVVSFIDDDGHPDVYTRLYPIFQSANVGFGAALITNGIGGSGAMTVAQLQTMHNSGLFETMSHTHNHVQLETLTDAEVEYQCATSKQWLLDHDLDASALVLPHNTSNKSSRLIARKYFDTLYTAYAFNDKGYIDPSQIQRIGFGSYTEGYNPPISGISDVDSLEYHKACVDKAITDGSWLVYMTHIHNQDASADTKLAELIEYIKSSGATIMKPTDAFQIKRNPLSVGDYQGIHLFMGNDQYKTNISHYQKHDQSKVEGGAIASVTPDKFPPGVVSVYMFNYNSGSGYPGTAGTLENYYNPSSIGWSWQRWYKYHSADSYYRYWDDSNNQWSAWIQTTMAIT